jgi:cytochrome o ubiquinol oxidase operon protein cyoD
MFSPDTYEAAMPSTRLERWRRYRHPRPGRPRASGPFALVQWNPGIPRVPVLIGVGAFALLQMLVHFRFFLHIGFRRQRDDLQLILFSTLLLIMMGDTIWSMASLAAHMMLDATP